MKTCIIYLRVSREKDGEKELSISSQQEQCEQKAEKLNAKVLNVFCDRDKSGRKNTRPDFQKALLYCENLKVDYFIVWSTSRFSRNIMDAKNDKLRLEKAGTKVKYVTLEVDDTSNAGFLLLSVIETLDEYQSRQIGVDTRRSLVRNASEGYFNGGRVSFGFMVISDIHDKKKKRLTINQNESAVVKRIFEMRATGVGAKVIADMLNNEGVSCRSSQWTKTRVTSLLRNEKVIGITVFGKKNHEGVSQPEDKQLRVKSHDQIIDKKLWEKVQQAMDNATNPQEYGSPKSTWMFTGLIKCEHCNLNLKIFSGKGRSKRYYYYACPNSKNGLNCKTKPVPSEKLDNWLTENLKKIVFTERNIRAITKELNKASKNWTTEKSALKEKTARELTAINKKTEILYQYLEDPDLPANPRDLLPRISINNKKIEKLKTKLNEIESFYAQKPVDINPYELAEFLTEKLLSKTSPQARRNFVRSFIKSVTLSDKNIEIEYVPASLLQNDNLLVHSKKKWLPDHRLLRTITISLVLPDKLPVAA